MFNNPKSPAILRNIKSMNKRALLLAMLSFPAAIYAAERSKVVFFEEFDRYGDFLPAFNAGTSISEYPPSLKNLDFNPKTPTQLRKEFFQLQTPLKGKSALMSFRFRFPNTPERAFQLQLQYGKQIQTLNIAENGAYFDNNSANEAEFGFPNWQWNQALVLFEDGRTTFFVVRDGKLVKEAEAKAPDGKLTGFNFFSGNPVHLDSIVIRDNAGRQDLTELRDYIELYKHVPEPAADDISKLNSKSPVGDLEFKVKKGEIPNELKIDFKSGGQSYPLTLQVVDTEFTRQVRSIPAGKSQFEQKNEKQKLPDAAFRAKFGSIVKQVWIRPRLQDRYEYPEAAEIAANYDKFPGASQHYLHIKLTGAPQDSQYQYQLYLDGKYFGKILTAAPVDSVELNLGSAGKVADIKRTPLSDKYLPTNLFLPLNVTALQHPFGPLTGEVTLTDNKIPMQVADSRYALNLSHCKENLGSFMLECDGYLQRDAFDGMPSSMHFSVPTAQYNKAYALCAVNPNAPADFVPVITARLTNFAKPGQGRAQAICDVSVTLPAKPDTPLPPNVSVAGKVGDVTLYLVEFNFDIGSIQDVLVMEQNPQLDFEFVGKLNDKDNYYFDRSRKPADDKSSVIVYAATLKRSPLEFSAMPGRTTNTYYPDEKPSMSYTVKSLENQPFSVKITVSDIDGRKLYEKVDKFTSADPGVQQVFFPQKDFGWYGVKFEAITNSGEVAVTHKSSFILLPPDTRKASYESPYFVWNFNGAHYTPRGVDNWGDILKRLGVRRTHVDSEAAGAKYGLTLGQYFSIHTVKTEAEASAKIKDFVAKYPHVKQAMIFHESGGGPYPMELVGEITAIDENQEKRDKDRTQQALFIAQMWRKYAPDVKLVIGNSGYSVGLLAQLFREKYPREFIDAMGEESVGMTMPPERSLAYSNWQLKQLAEIYNYKNLGPEACYEWKSRVIRHFSPSLHAAFIVRDALIAHAWGQKLIGVPCVTEMGNSYYNSIWGEGSYSRYPLMYPHPVAAAVATLTDVLDCAKFTRQLSTGSNTVYALEFTKGNEKVYALWTARGEIDAEIYASNNQLTQHDLFGKITPINLKANQGKITISEEPIYLVTSGAITSVKADGTRRYPNEVYPAAAKKSKVVTADDSGKWHLDLSEDKRLQTGNKDPGFLYFMKPGSYLMRSTDDAEQGKCLELEFKPAEKSQPLVAEYAFIRLKEPVEIAGRPDTLALEISGNSSWGKVYFEIEDAQGEVWVSAGTGGYGCSTYDWPDKMGLNFDSWNELKFPLTGDSPIKVHAPGENQWQWQRDGKGDGVIQFPVKLRGIGVSNYPRSLKLTEMKDINPIIRIKNVYAYEKEK